MSSRTEKLRKEIIAEIKEAIKAKGGEFIPENYGGEEYQLLFYPHNNSRSPEYGVSRMTEQCFWAVQFYDKQEERFDYDEDRVYTEHLEEFLEHIKNN